MSNISNSAKRGLTAIAVLLLTAAAVFTSCTPVEPELPANAGLAKAQALSYTNEPGTRTVVLRWNLTADTTMSGIQITVNGANPLEIDSVVTSYTLRHVVPNEDVLYTVKVRYKNGMVSEGTSVNVHIRYDLPIYAGYLLTAGSIGELADDDERAAAEWFEREYVQKDKGCFVRMEELATIDLDRVACLWIHIDREGLVRGWQNLPENVRSEAFLTNLRAYAREGGKMFFSVHATQLIAAIGRISDEHAPNEVASGQGGLADTWTMNAYLGYGGETEYDRRGHRYFKDMVLDYYNKYEYTSFPMLSDGVHEDHNSLWNLSSMRFTAGSNKVRGFEIEYSCQCLATWGQNTDLGYIGMVEFYPTELYRGTIVAMGLGCYEWAMAGGNLYQRQIEKFTSNVLEDLRK